MFWWGKSKPKSEVVQVLEHEISCPKCHDIGEMYLWGYTKYLHIYWILPMWNIGKKVKVGCDSCDETFSLKKVNGVSKAEVEAVKAQIRRPIWHFTGLIIISLLILFIVYAFISGHFNDKARFNHPQVNDIYIINGDKWDEDYATSWQLIKISKDSMTFVENLRQAEGVWDMPDTLDINSQHKGDTVRYSKDQIKNLYDRDVIFRVRRKNIE